LQRCQRRGDVGIALKDDGRQTAAESTRASDHDGRPAQRDYRLLDLKIYLEA